jgi:hypothetical protein
MLERERLIQSRVKLTEGELKKVRAAAKVLGWGSLNLPTATLLRALIRLKIDEVLQEKKTPWARGLFTVNPLPIPILLLASLFTCFAFTSSKAASNTAIFFHPMATIRKEQEDNVFRGKLKKGIPFERAKSSGIGSCESVA